MNKRKYYQKALNGIALPAAFIDLDHFDNNIKEVIRRSKNKLIRIATKSIRSVRMLQRIEKEFKLHKKYCGYMCYSPWECITLAGLGFNQLLMGYPTTDNRAIKKLLELSSEGLDITFMVDSFTQCEILNSIAKTLDIKATVCIDIDMSIKFPFLYFGVYRSSINNIQSLTKFIEDISALKYIQIIGLMGYEAQIAGVGDQFKNEMPKNLAVRILKQLSYPKILKRRKEAYEFIESQGNKLRFINGGGTGSLEFTTSDPVVTEVTIGSALYCSTLFDGYEKFKHAPSAGYAIQVTRQASDHIYTCAGGGFVASGACEQKKLPSVWFPEDGKLLDQEGAGEVQTPIKTNEKLNIGELVIMRHAKSGELCEHFNDLHLIRDGKISEAVHTYRGDGYDF